MKELMIHVERIVRPVIATQGRKLRMRMELLAHVQAALDEERHRSPGDERTAIEHAKLRLGEPVELTSKLQQSVPAVERILLARLPVSRRIDLWERQAARRLYGKRIGAMTIGHITILSGMAILLAVIPFFISVRKAVASSGMQPTHNMLFFFGVNIGWLVLLLASYRFVFAAAIPNNHLDWRDTFKRSATILTLQIALLMFFAAFAIPDRSGSIWNVITCAASTLVLLAISTLIARQIGMLRRPYDEWLTLNLAE